MKNSLLIIALLFTAAFGQTAPACAFSAYNNNDGLSALEAGDLEKAEAELQIARFNEPNNPIIAYNLGIVSYRKRDYQKAAAFFSKASQDADKTIKFESLYNLGNSAFKMQNYAMAVGAYTSCLEVKDSDTAEYNLAVAKEKLKKQLEEQQKQQQQNKQDKQDKQNKQSNNGQQQQDKANQQQNGSQEQQKQQGQQGQQGQKEQQGQKGQQGQKEQQGQQSAQNSNDKQNSQNGQNAQEGKNYSQNNKANEQQADKQNENSQNRPNQTQTDQNNKDGKKEGSEPQKADDSAKADENASQTQSLSDKEQDDPSKDRRDIEMAKPDEDKAPKPPQASQRARAMKNTRLNEYQVQRLLKQMEEREREAQIYGRTDIRPEDDPYQMNEQQLKEFFNRRRQQHRQQTDAPDW